MRERYFAGAAPASAANQARVRNRVMRRTEGTLAHQRRIGRPHVVHRIDARDLQRFFKREGRQNGRHRTREQGFARSWGTHHQDVVDSCLILQGNLNCGIMQAMPVLKKTTANWITSFKNDIESGRHMFTIRRYILVIFMCHTM